MKRCRPNAVIFFLALTLQGLFSCQMTFQDYTKQALENGDTLKCKTFNYPVLKRKTDNPLIRLTIFSATEGKMLSDIKFSMGDDALAAIKMVKAYYTSNRPQFDNKSLLGSIHPEKSRVAVSGEQLLEKGVNYFWIALEPNDDADLTSLINLVVDAIKMDGKLIKPYHQNVLKARLGVAVRNHGDDNVHTYRIPGLVTTNNGTLLAIYDVRRNSGRDLQGDIDIGVSRSTNEGNTWEPMRIALNMGQWGGLPEKFNGVSDANVLVDRASGAVYIAGLWMHGVINPEGVWQKGLTSDSQIWNHQWRNKGSQPGFGVMQTSQFLLTKSIDDGQTWGSPLNLTTMCKKEKWWLWAPAPGHGICLKNGTLVFPSQGRDENGLPFSNITYSMNGGKTWQTSEAAAHNTTESMAVELDDGTVMLNMRDNRNRKEKGDSNGRAVAVTSDMGETWRVHPSSHRALIEPTCMASIHKHVYRNASNEEKSILFFSNPNSKVAREHQTIKVSFDNGETWPEKYWIELDEGRGAGYSCITSVNQHTIGILYEGSQAQMTFQKIDVSHLL